MSVPDPSASLAFRYPRKVADCSCPICTRIGDPSADTNYPSPFALYRLIKWDVEKQIEREPNEEERAEFNRLYPAMAYSRTAEAGGKMETPWIKLALKLIRRLRKEKIAVSFNAPVDPVALNIPDYLTIIKHPMDLGTVENKLIATEAKQAAADVDDESMAFSNDESPAKPIPDTYAAPEDFASDVRMIWRNTFLYNKPELAIYQWAREMSIKFETAWAQL